MIVVRLLMDVAKIDQRYTRTGNEMFRVSGPFPTDGNLSCEQRPVVPSPGIENLILRPSSRHASRKTESLQWAVFLRIVTSSCSA